MTDKEKLDAIRTEIHRLVDVRGYDREIANDLFAFMDSLPNEPVSYDLEKAAKAYSNNIDNICGGIGEQTRNAFKAGAKWQKEHLWKPADGDEIDHFIEEFRNYMEGE